MTTRNPRAQRHAFTSWRTPEGDVRSACGDASEDIRAMRSDDVLIADANFERRRHCGDAAHVAATGRRLLDLLGL